MPFNADDALYYDEREDVKIMEASIATGSPSTMRRGSVSIF